MRMYRGNDYHGKGFLFQNQENFNLMVGSSNLTGDGISKNDELNLNVTCGENSKVVIDFIDLFEQKFQSAEAITDELIQAYEEEYYRRPNSQDIEDHVLDKKDDTGEISPFDFQQDALDRLNMYREEGKKSIIISATGTGKPSYPRLMLRICSQKNAVCCS